MLSKEKSCSQKMKELCTKNFLQDDDDGNDDDGFELDLVSSPSSNIATSTSSIQRFQLETIFTLRYVVT